MALVYKEIHSHFSIFQIIIIISREKKNTVYVFSSIAFYVAVIVNIKIIITLLLLEK